LGDGLIGARPDQMGFIVVGKLGRQAHAIGCVG
jgi:hypothetical protein